MKRRKGRTVAIVAGAGVLALALLLGVYWEEIAAWIKFVRTFEHIGTNQQGYAEYRHRQTEIVFVKLPGGTFWMGSSQEELEELLWRKYGKDEKSMKKSIKDWFVQELPKHQVTLSPFLISKYEVTQAQWIQVVGGNPSYFHPGRSNPILRKPNARRHLPSDFFASEKSMLLLPVETVTWNECMEFCEKNGFDLPSEAQWEYACRAGTMGAYGGTGKLDEMGWQGEDCNYPVGLKKPNAFGLYDMHGNVAEWCKDVYNGKFYSHPEATMPNAFCNFGSSGRVYRGGGWEMATFHHRSAYRFHGKTSGGRVNESPPGYVGFRPAYYPLP